MRTLAPRLRPVVSLALVAVFAAAPACSSDPYRAARATRVSREQLLVAHHPRADAYFSAVHGAQYAMGTVDARRADLTSALSRALGRLPNADRVELESALRDAMRTANINAIRVRRGAAPDPMARELEPRVAAWRDAVLATSTDADAARALIDAQYQRLVDSLELTVESDLDAPALRPVLDAIAAVLRDAEATQRCMAVFLPTLPPVLVDEATPRAEAPALTAEFDAARTFTQSLRARAEQQTLESTRTARWFDTVLAGDTEEGGAAP